MHGLTPFRLLDFQTGIGLVAGSTATIESAEIRENQDGIIALDQGTRLRASKLKIIGNTDAGLFVRSNADANVTDSDFKNNARGAIAGVKGKSSERATLTLAESRFGGSRYFGVGACTQSQVTLTNCTFDGTDKQNAFKERGANVQTNEPQPSPPDEAATPVPPNDAESSPVPTESASPSVSPTGSPAREKKNTKPHHKPTPRSHPPTPEDLRRALRRLLPGGP